MDLTSKLFKEKIMKSARLTCITTIALLVAPAIPVSLAAQEHPTKHHKYNLVDIGTFGGPNIFFNQFGFPNTLLGSNGTVTAGADTSTVDPYCFNNPDCFLEHAFKWQEGVMSDLGALPGGSGNNDSQAFWINDRGQTVGASTIGVIDPLRNVPFVHAVLWSDLGKIHDLGTLGGLDSASQAINSRGQVVGVAENAIPDPYNLFDYQIFGISAGTQSRAFLWDRKAGMQDLGTLPAGNNAFAAFLNERGQIAGYSHTNTTPNSFNSYWCGNNPPTTDPFFWENGKMYDIGTLGGNCGVAMGLNNQGQVIGVSDLAGDVFSHAFRWDKKGRLQDLATLGGNYGQANSINDAGDAVGWAYTAGDVIFHTVIWPNGKATPTDLGVITGYAFSFADAINSKGQITGGLTNTDGSCPPNDSAAFLWENGDMVDLNTLVPPHPGVQLTGCDAYINDRGDILTLGNLSDGDTHAFLLTPCDDNHGDSGNCEERTGGATATAQSSSTLVMQNPRTTAEGSSSTNDRTSAVRGRLGRRYPYRGLGASQAK
jgi:probable HAF family extracellular repeat protein